MFKLAACRTCNAPNPHLIARASRATRFAGAHLNPPLNGGALFWCRNCDLLQRSPILSPDEYSALYVSAGDHWPQVILRPDQSKVRDYIFKALPEGGKVLDIGCAGGALLDSLGAAYEKYGVEPSAEAAGKASQLGISIVATSVEELSTSTQCFDLICAVDVIEHVPDPLKFLLQLSPHLNAGGQIVISTGNSRAAMWRIVGASYYYSHYFEHISFISPKWCDFAQSRGFNFKIIDPGFRHEVEGTGGLGVRLLRFFGRWILSLAERSILMRFPGTAKRLGPYLSVGEPGLFRDHLMVSFDSAASATSCTATPPLQTFRRGPDGRESVTEAPAHQ